MFVKVHCLPDSQTFLYKVKGMNASKFADFKTYTQQKCYYPDVAVYEIDQHGVRTEITTDEQFMQALANTNKLFVDSRDLLIDFDRFSDGEYIDFQQQEVFSLPSEDSQFDEIHHSEPQCLSISDHTYEPEQPQKTQAQTQPEEIANATKVPKPLSFADNGRDCSVKGMLLLGKFISGVVQEQVASRHRTLLSLVNIQKGSIKRLSEIYKRSK